MVARKNSPIDAILGDAHDIINWLQKVTQHHSEESQRNLIQAYQFIAEFYQSEPVETRERHIAHILTMIEILSELGMEMEVLVAATLHNAIEQNYTTLDIIRKRFGTTVENLVDGITKMKFFDKLSNCKIRNSKDNEQQSESLRKMLLAMAEDIRVVLIKLAERLHYMRVLYEFSAEKRHQFAHETLELFTPLANRLGVWQIKWELEDLSLRYLEPDVYKSLARLLEEKRVHREEYINRVIQILRSELEKENIQAEITGRPKHIYSIWRKMERKGIKYHQLSDVRAVRVLVDTVPECYAVLGIMHSKWPPIEHELDDYIGKPKKNGYQSLHTTVEGPEQKTVEIQIRTYEMHHHAEFGVASHWRYKEGKLKGSDPRFEQGISWLRQMLQWREDENDVGEVIDQFKLEILDNRVYVLSPKGEVIALPQGSTPLDFAYYIHTELGHRCRGAKVNDKIMPLIYILKTGDQVEIISGKEEKPSRDWLIPHLGYLKTPRARGRVKQWLRKQDTKQNTTNGKALLERELKRLNIKNPNLQWFAQHFNLNSVDEFLAALGNGDMTIGQVTQTINEQILSPKKPVPKRTSPTLIQSDVKIHGILGLATHIAGCCHPEPPAPIIGYVTVGRGVVIHHSDCPNSQRWQDEGNERLVEVSWVNDDESEVTVYPIDVHVYAYDRKGLLRDITNITTEKNINIIAANTVTNKEDGTVTMLLTLEVMDVSQLSQALAAIDRLSNVMEVMRKT